ncbi:MAG TPA: response regulator [Sandaracinaceae bacterium]
MTTRMPVPSHPPPLVLLAEDDDEMRYLMTRALRRDGYDVLAAADAEALSSALMAARLHGREPDLVVSDVRMPGMSGLELVAWLRRQDCDVRIVLVSAFADDEIVAEARRLGVAHVLSKPFDLDDLRTVVLHLLSPPRGSVPPA